MITIQEHLKDDERFLLTFTGKDNLSVSTYGESNMTMIHLTNKQIQLIARFVIKRGLAVVFGED